jgi:hypothetical protein
MTYRYEFDEMGGYDCMYGAFRISGPDGVVVEVDLQHHGQESCDYKDEASKAKAEVFAKRITDALNGSGEAEGEDAKRLDWLEQLTIPSEEINDLIRNWCVNGKRYPEGIRAAVDAAMRVWT